MNKTELYVLLKLLEESIRKWEWIEDLIYHTHKHPCLLCQAMIEGVIKKCPLNSKCKVNNTNCCQEWEEVRLAVIKMKNKLIRCSMDIQKKMDNELEEEKVVK